MRKLLTATLAALTLAPVARAGEGKIAIVDFANAALATDEGKAVMSDLRKEMDEKQKQLDAKVKELQDLRADYDKQATLLSETAKQAKQAEYGKRMQDLQQTYEQLQEDFTKKQANVEKSMGERMRQIVKEIAEGGGFQLVLDRPAAIWYAPALDITNEVIRKFNARYPAKGAAAGGVKPAGGAKPK